MLCYICTQVFLRSCFSTILVRSLHMQTFEFVLNGRNVHESKAVRMAPDPTASYWLVIIYRQNIIMQFTVYVQSRQKHMLVAC